MTAPPTTLPVQRFDPTPCNFPPPRVPVLPPLRGARLQWAANRLPTEVRHFSRGRYALLAAYRLAGVGPSGALLAPPTTASPCSTRPCGWAPKSASIP